MEGKVIKILVVEGNVKKVHKQTVPEGLRKEKRRTLRSSISPKKGV